jgi:hypothetical protein
MIVATNMTSIRVNPQGTDLNFVFTATPRGRKCIFCAAVGRASSLSPFTIEMTEGMKFETGWEACPTEPLRLLGRSPLCQCSKSRQSVCTQER